MQKSISLLNSLGELIRAHRSAKMDQSELAIRAGVGRSTISALENGKSVSAESLFRVLERLELIDDIQEVVDDKLRLTTVKLQRKTRKLREELNNDF